MFKLVRKIYDEVIADQKDAPTFIVLVFFLLTFIIARATVYLIDYEVIPDIYVSVGQTHIHHLNFGIFALAISGYLSLVVHKKRFANFLSMLYGTGLALTFDEFSIWLRLNDNYYARLSYESIIVIAVILINIVYFGQLWVKIFQKIRNLSKKGQRLIP